MKEKNIHNIDELVEQDSFLNRVVKRFLAKTPSLHFLLLGNASLFFSRMFLYALNITIFFSTGFYWALLPVTLLAMIDLFFHLQTNYILYQGIVLENNTIKGLA